MGGNRKDTKPKIFLVLKIVGFSLAAAGVVLLILGIATPDPSSSNSLFAGTAQKMGVIFGGAACLIISISLIFAGFTPSIKRIQVKTTKYIVSDNNAYVNVANNLSVDCDCDANPHAPEMADIGIFASLDPVAVDQCCYDAVMNSTDPGKAALIERMVSRHAIHTVEEAARLGVGTREYELVEI